MPKGKKKKGVAGGRKSNESRQSSENEYDTPDNASVASSAWSDGQSVIDEDAQEGGQETDEIGTQEDFEEKLKEAIDGTTAKSAEGRKTCLKGIQQALRKKYIYDFVAERKITLADCFEKCLKKGKGEEQVLAAACTSLLCLQLGAGEDTEAVYKDIKPIVQAVFLDKTAAVKARSECATTLGICTFVSVTDLEEVKTVMNTLESVFKASYLKGDGVAPTHTPEVTSLHCSALAAWSLLLSISPPGTVMEIVKTHLKKLPQLLESANVEMRIAAGETIALLYELAREQNEDFQGDKIDKLCATLKELATDSNKYRAKKDRRHQRSSFREIMRTVELGEVPEFSIKFGSEHLYIDSWVQKRQYDALCMALGPGMNTHLQENELVRDIFSLGAPLLGGPVAKISRAERHFYNAAAAKIRTRIRAKSRDKRSVAMASS